MIYEKLAKATKDSYLISLYDNRCKELASMIKVCEYNCGGNVSVAASDIMELTLNESSMDIEVELIQLFYFILFRNWFLILQVVLKRSQSKKLTKKSEKRSRSRKRLD